MKSYTSAVQPFHDSGTPKAVVKGQWRTQDFILGV